MTWERVVFPLTCVSTVVALSTEHVIEELFRPERIEGSQGEKDARDLNLPRSAPPFAIPGACELDDSNRRRPGKDPVWIQEAR